MVAHNNITCKCPHCISPFTSMLFPKGGYLSNLATQQAYNNVCNTGSLDCSRWLQVMIAQLASVTCTGHKMDRFLIKDYKKQSYRQIMKIKILRKQQMKINMKTPKRGQGGKLKVFGVEKKKTLRGKHYEHRQFQEKWTDHFLFVPHGATPLCLTNLHLFQMKQLLTCSKQCIQNSIKVIHLAAHQEREKQHTVLEFVSRKILFTGKLLLQSI